MDQLLFPAFLLLLTFARAQCHQGEVFTECSVNSQHCVFEDNILSIINNVTTLEQCRLMCKEEKDCRYITYYDAFFAQGDPFAGSCILFSHCSLREHRCTGCVTEDTHCTTVLEPCSAPVHGTVLLFRSKNALLIDTRPSWR